MSIPTINGAITGTDLTSAINDRIRRISQALGQATAGGTGTTGATGPAGAPGAAGASYSTIDPRLYGAVADGATDDSAAISLAIAQGGLYLQSGKVYGYTWGGISAAILAVIIGSNKFMVYGGGSLRLLSGSTSAISLTGGSHLTFQDVVIDGNGQCGANPVFYAHGAYCLHLVDVLVIGGTTGQAGISLTLCGEAVLDRVDVSAEAPGLVAGSGTTYNAVNCHGMLDNGGF